MATTQQVIVYNQHIKDYELGDKTRSCNLRSKETTGVQIL